MNLLLLQWNNGPDYGPADPFENAGTGIFLTVITVSLIILVVAFVIGIISAKKEITNHWSHLIRGLSYSTKSFYEQLRDKVLDQGLTDVRVWSKNLSTGGMFSVKRHYLFVSWQGCNYEVCASPFGHAFFISYRAVESPNYMAEGLSKMPWIGKSISGLARPKTFYQMDTEAMFHKIFHESVMELVESISKEHQKPILSEKEKTPMMRDLFKR